MQRIYNTISVLTFALVAAQLVGVAYLYSNRESIKDAIIDEAISAVLSSVTCLVLAANCLVQTPFLQ